MIKRIKNLIIDLLPPLFALKLCYILSRPKIGMEIPLGKKVFVFLAADYGNMGDVAITYAQKRILQMIFPDRVIVEVPTSISVAEIKHIFQRSTKNDIVTTVGGGNMGDLYDMFELYRQLVLWVFRKNRQISFPQTAEFSNRERGKQLLHSAKSVYSNKNLTLLAREDVSYEFMKSNFSCLVKLTPDIVMTLDYSKTHNRNGVLFCFRNDGEKNIEESEITKMKQIVSQSDTYKICDTWIGDEYIYEERVAQLYGLLDEIASSKIFITDRLHGMIFAFLTRTPAIVFSNSNWKISRCFNWIKGCGYIHYVDHFEESHFMDVYRGLLGKPVDERVVEKMQKLFVSHFLEAIES